MPEMPEVEIIVQGLRRQIAREMIRDVRVRWRRSIDRPDVQEFVEQLCGQAIERDKVAGRGTYYCPVCQQWDVGTRNGATTL
ncbi:MAG: DNA-formamidopyrimidine glycosylase family protein [Chloroflexota bacterium]|nr:DNA-formamidopyrimidine glycosylase family protein [Chloroflexota bacterium]